MEGAVQPLTEPYFHGRISRDEAELMLRTEGCQEGLYLLRESMSKAGNYAVSICHNGGFHHYSVEQQSDGQVKIKDGRRFKGPVELINHHKLCQDGFLTRPRLPCNRADGIPPYAWPGVTMAELESHLINEAKAKGFTKNYAEICRGPQRHRFVSMVAKNLHEDQPWFHGHVEREKVDSVLAESGHKDGKYLVRARGGEARSYALSFSYKNMTKHYKIDKHNTPTGEKFAIEDGPKFDSLIDMIAQYNKRADGLLCRLTEACVRPGFQPKRVFDLHEDVRAIDDSQKIYDHIPCTEDVFNLNKDELKLEGELGAGNFGSVMKGRYRWNGQSVPVAVKTLKQNEVSAAKEELLREARLMASLTHRHIVRMIGVCKAELIMLVLELAPLGPLNKYLKQHLEMPIQNITELVFQVAEGMSFLESKNFVHRDLAARNVLLVNESFAKISDFGMSKALGIDNEYYKANAAGKWPIKWYAPECIYFFKFDSKSDVWSFGVTMWEAFSYGQKPYKGMDGNKILDLITHNKRLEKPVRCPSGVYDVMLKCWQYRKEDRPTFGEVIDLLRPYK